MSPLTIGVIAVLTFATRLSGTVLLPPARGRVFTVLERFPAPLFACLGATALIDQRGELEPIAVVVATAASVVAALKTRSLPIIGGVGALAFVVSSIVK